MKQTFFTKYRDYYQSLDLKEEIFKMKFKENETLEEYIDRFQYNLQISPYTTLPKEVLKIALIIGMKNEWIEIFNLMGKGDISKEEYNDILKLCIRCSHGSTRNKLGIHDSLSRTNRTTSGGVRRLEIGNLLENFRIDILSTLTTQFDVF